MLRPFAASDEGLTRPWHLVIVRLCRPSHRWPRTFRFLALHGQQVLDAAVKPLLRDLRASQHHGRTYREGKRIGLKDGFQALN